MVGSQKDINRKLILIIGGAGVLCLGLFGWLTYSDWKTIEEQEKKTKGLRGEIARAEAEIQRIPALEEEVLVLRDRVEEYVTILPDDAEINAFVDKLTQFEEQSGVAFSELDDSSARQRRIRRRKAKDAFDRVSYKLRLTGSTEKILRFMDLLENEYDRFVRIPAFKVMAHDPQREGLGPHGERSHTVEVEIETYVYNPKAKGRDLVAIRGEAVKLKRLRDTGRLDAHPDDLRVAKYDYKPRPERRDPFVDPRLTVARAGAVTEADRRAQLQALERLGTTLEGVRSAIAAEATIENTVRRIQTQEANNARLQDLGREVIRLSEEKFFTVPEYARRFHEEVEVPTQALLQARGRVSGLVVQRKELEEHVARMAAALDTRDYAEVVSLHDQIKRFREAASTDETLAPLFRRADELKRLATTYLEFAAKSLEFGGCVCFEDDPRRAVVIINRKSYSPGELVDDGLVITSITPSEVMFDFRGVKVSRRLHSGSLR